MRKVKTFLVMLAFLGLSVSAAYAQKEYSIRTSIGGYSVVYEGGHLNNLTPIQAAIDWIKADAAGGDCIINFGGTSVLDIGGGNTTLITFDGSGTPTWGKITLMGKVTSSSTATAGIIRLEEGVSIDCKKAELTTTGAGAYLIYNNSTGTVSISEGVVSATTGRAVHNQSSGAVSISGGVVSATTGTSGAAVYNNSNGTVNISDGTVSTLSSYAVYNNSTGAITISGGTVSATGSGNAVQNHSTGEVKISGGTISANLGVAVRDDLYGKITVSGTAKITSACVATSDLGTIFLSNNSYNSCWLEITGGTVENTSTGAAIRNNSTSMIAISGGTVSATAGVAIWNNSAGKITVSGEALVTSAYADSTYGTIFLYNGATTITACRLEITGNGTVENTSTGTAVCNDSYGAIEIRGGTVSATAGNAIYNDHAVATISGGTISSTDGNAIYNGYEKVTVSGGTILATNGYAIFNLEGTAILDGDAIAFAYGTAVTDVVEGSYTQTGDAVIVAWDEAELTYDAGTDDGIFKFPSTATAVWAKQGGNGGISVANGSATGFIPVEGVTIVYTYTVTFLSEGIPFDIQYVEDGNKVSKPDPDPEREDYDFDGWFIDDITFADEWDFDNDLVTSDITLYAKWTEITGIAGIKSADIKVYPNPVKDQVYIENGGLKIESLELYDMHGKKLSTLSPLSTPIDVSHLPSGIYFVKAGEKTVKIVKQ